MNPFTDNRLSLEAKGALAYAIAARVEVVTAQTIQGPGCGRERSYRILSELAGAGYLTRVSNGYRVTANPSIIELSPGEGIENYGFSENPYITTSELRLTRNSDIRLTRNSLAQSASCMYRDHDLMHDEVSEPQELPETRNSQPEVTEKPYISDELTQQTLDGLPGTPPPCSAAAPSPDEPTKPRRPRPPAPPAETKALYGPMFDLTKRPRSGKSAMGVYQKCAALWREFQATPEQVAAFWDWFKVFSYPAQVAAREQRQLNPPMPKQVHELWPQFLPWWEARQQDIARRAEAEQRRRERVETADDRPGDARLYNPFRNRFARPVVAATD